MDCAKPDNHATHRWLTKNQRLLLQHGPIDLVIQIDADEQERVLAFEQAIRFFDTVLVSLVGELQSLRKPIGQLRHVEFDSEVAQQMYAAVKPYACHFVTPMAAVAGAVADLMLNKLCSERNLSRVAVNNGGDIALYLKGEATYTVGICDDPTSGTQHASAHIDAASSVRGIATSGWHGRSFSMGIADAVTVLASNASNADVAATLIANQIDLPESTKVARILQGQRLVIGQTPLIDWRQSA